MENNRAPGGEVGLAIEAVLHYSLGHQPEVS